MNMHKLSILALLFVFFCTSGCATVPLEAPEVSAKAKEFATPPADKAGLYIYRSSFVGQSLKKDIWVDGICVGQSANNIFFYHEVSGDKEHTIATESEFSPNGLKITTRGSTNYFIEQDINMGLFVGGADLELIDPEIAKKDIVKLDMALSGKCSTAAP